MKAVKYPSMDGVYQRENIRTSGGTELTERI